LGRIACPDSGYGPEGDMHPWGPMSVLLVYAVNFVLYSGLVYLGSWMRGRFRKTSR